MALHVQQFSDGVMTYECDVQVPEGVSDAEYLAVKAASAEKYGWSVERRDGRVVASKVRWRGVLCTRVFEVR
jgi:hypothetical protein